MRAYELLYFVAPTADDEARAAVNARIEAIAKEDGGQIDEVDDWGRKKLSYEIDGLADADYTLINLHMDPASVAELDRVLRINNTVVRHMIVARPDRD